MPFTFVLLLAAGAFALSIFGVRGLLGIRDALRSGEFDRLGSPELWTATRAFCGLVAALPLWPVVLPVGGALWLAPLSVGALGYWVAPQFLRAAQRRAAETALDDLALHLDLLALAMEAGSSLPAALALCSERVPDGALRRAWRRVVLEIHAGVEPLDALRNLEQRLGLRAITTLVNELRSAQKLGLDGAAVLRERARQAAARRFARAERLARAAPLKLWATLMLCIAPCTLVMLAFPLARLLALAVGR